MYTCYQCYDTQGIGEGKFLIPPGVTLPGSVIPGHKPTQVPTVVALARREEFLNTQSQQCHCVVGDGNCMFRAVSHQLYSREEFHLELRSVVQETLECNAHRYSCLWIGNDSFSEHIKAISQPGVWGTQVELQLISDYFSVPVFIGMPNSEGVYNWCAFKPKFDAFPQGSISKLLMPGYPFSSKEGSHIEIVQNTANSHYDSVIPISKSAFLDVPALKGDISDTIIL